MTEKRDGAGLEMGQTKGLAIRQPLLETWHVLFPRISNEGSLKGE